MAFERYLEHQREDEGVMDCSVLCKLLACKNAGDLGLKWIVMNEEESFVCHVLMCFSRGKV